MKSILPKLIRSVCVVAFLCPVFFVASGKAADLQVTTSVDQTVVGLNQEFTLTVEYSGGGANSAPDPELPDMSAFASYIGSSGTSSNFQFINGRMSVSKSFSYQFLATEVGQFQIPSVQVSHKGQIHKSKPIDIQVVKTAAPATPSRPDSRRLDDTAAASDIEGNLFVKASVNRRRVYQNQPVVVTYSIYTRVEVTSYGIAKLPNTVGFWAEEFPMPQRPVQRKEVVNGQQFVVADIKKMALFPTSPGEKTIDPLGVECEVRQPRTSRRRDFFDSFFDDPLFGRMVRTSVFSEPVTVEVIPLPEESKPADFSGAVGKFQISASVDKADVETDEAVTLAVKISGTGNIMMVSEPKVSIPADLEQYKPKSSEKINRENDLVSGGKTFEYVLVPRFPGQHHIKPISFSYFDLASKTYRTVSTSEILLNVRKGERQLVSIGPGISKEEVRLVGQDIQFIKRADLSLARQGAFVYKSLLFWLLTGFPAVVFVGALFYRRHLDELTENVAYARERRANRQAMRRLQRAKGFITEKTEKEFYAEISRGLLGFVADKLNRAAAGLITDDVEKELLAKDVSPEKVKGLVDCLKVCDYRRFAPGSSNVQDMQDFYSKAKAAIVDLESSL